MVATVGSDHYGSQFRPGRWFARSVGLQPGPRKHTAYAIAATGILILVDRSMKPTKVCGFELTKTAALPAKTQLESTKIGWFHLVAHLTWPGEVWYSALTCFACTR